MGKNLSKKRQSKARMSRKIDYNRPSSSPYAFPFVNLTIGKKQYGLPEHFLHDYPILDQQIMSGSSDLIISDIYEDVGHTFVHFLYSGNYETINSPLDEGTTDIAREYKRSILVYHASRTHGLPGLEVIAKQKIEQLGEDMPVSEILRATRDVFSSLPADETWLPLYIERNLQRLVKPGKTELEDLFETLGQDHGFDNTVMKIMLEILSSRLISLEDIVKEEGPKNDGRGGVIEATLEKPALEEPTPIEPIPEEPAPEEPAPEEPAPEEPAPEEPAIEEPMSEAFPANDPPVEEVITEASPAEESPDENKECWVFPEKPRGTEDWFNAPSSFAEAAHAEALPDVTTSSAEAPAESQPVQDDPGRVSYVDLALYDNWGSLSKKKRTARARKLKKKGLPVPSKDGLVSISSV